TRDAVINGLNSTSPHAIIEQFKGIINFDPSVALAGFSNPMLSINSDFNNFPFSLHNILPNLPTEAIQGTSHWVQMDQPDWVNTVLNDFLRAM
ncbi:MAG: alpha/beta hydrolase, partial [Gemmatimonadota bacterium]|nr:alpha/beta hydrolase [Gemmatimonadota bacterium]